MPWIVHYCQVWKYGSLSGIIGGIYYKICCIWDWIQINSINCVYSAAVSYITSLCADAGDRCWVWSHLTLDSGSYTPMSWTYGESGGCRWLRETGWVVAMVTTSY